MTCCTDALFGLSLILTVFNPKHARFICDFVRRPVETSVTQSVVQGTRVAAVLCSLDYHLPPDSVSMEPRRWDESRAHEDLRKQLCTDKGALSDMKVWSISGL